MQRVPDAESASFVVTAGPLRVEVDADGTVRLGWGEADWLGPGRLIAPGDAAPTVRGSTSPTGAAGAAGATGAVVVESGWVSGRVRALPGEPVVCLGLETAGPQSGFGTGDFATPAVAWHFDPLGR